MLKTFTSLFFILLSLGCLAQIKVYKLIDSSKASDINYEAIISMKKQNPGVKLLDHVFNTLKGKYKVYRFMASYTGISGMSNEEKEFHDIIIVKTNEANKVIDAYMYNLDFSDPPSMNAIYRRTSKNIYLNDKMSISDFKFTRPHYFDSEDIELNEKAELSFTKYSGLSKFEIKI